MAVLNLNWPDQTYSSSNKPSAETLQQDLIAIETVVNAIAGTATILADGSVEFASDQSMGGNKLTTLGTPTAAQDATTKAYVDARGLPTGGTKGQTIEKDSSTDYDVSWVDNTKYIQVIVTAPDSDVTTGDGKVYMHIPAGLNGTNLTEVHAELVTAGGSGTTDIQIHNVTDGVDMLSTKLTIDANETGSDTAAAAAVINTSNDDVATNDKLRIDVDAVSSGGSPAATAQGLIVTLGFKK
jgi:hypothetical protein